MTMEMERKRNPVTRPRRLPFPTAAVFAAILAALMLGIGGSAAPHAQTAGSLQEMEFPRSRVTIETATGRYDFTVEVADTRARRARGLQHRRELAADAGMLFDYKESRPVAMWMKNTDLPLDMLFVDAAGRVVRVAEDTEPLSLTPIPSGEPVRAVVELNAGTARRLRIGPGDRVHHPIFDAPAK